VVERLAAQLAWTLALFLTLAALALNNITLAHDHYLKVVLAAIACAITALVLIAACWKRQGLLGRAVSVLAVLANAWTLLDTLGRRLPALLQD